MTQPAPAKAVCEEVLDPGQRIVDAHHHLYERSGLRYLADEFLKDLASGHDVRATVFVQARSMLRSEGPEAMKPVGETEYAAGVADLCVSGNSMPMLCAAIVGQVDLTLGDAVLPVLRAHIEAGRDRFRGVRHVAAWDADASLVNPVYPTTADLLDSPAFRAGFAHLEALGLSFDAWLLFPQIPRLTKLARAFPNIPIALNHCGGIVGIGAYAGRRLEVYSQWAASLRELADCPNVMVKLGGLGMPLSGFGFDAREREPKSSDLATAWHPWIDHSIELFGPKRCMFGSNFPADRVSHSYATGWNAMKRIAQGASPDAKDSLFWRSASRFYTLA